MEDFLFSGENIIETKGANFLLGLNEHGMQQLGPLGTDTEMRLLGLPEGYESIGGCLYLTNFRLFFRSHRFNRFKGAFSIFLPNIIETALSPTDKTMNVAAQKQVFMFVIWGIPKFIAALAAAAAARDQLSPVQRREDLRGASSTARPKNAGTVLISLRR